MTVTVAEINSYMAGRSRNSVAGTKPRRTSVGRSRRSSSRSATQGGRTKSRKNAKSTINKMSGFLLGANKVLRDVNAVHKGTIADRIVRRMTGKVASQGLDADFLKFKK